MPIGKTVALVAYTRIEKKKQKEQFSFHDKIQQKPLGHMLRMIKIKPANEDHDSSISRITTKFQSKGRYYKYFSSRITRFWSVKYPVDYKCFRTEKITNVTQWSNFRL